MSSGELAMTLGGHLLCGSLSLGSVGMLLWGLAAFIPVAIHLWNRRRYDQTPWAAMQFLSAAVRRNSRRLQVEQWLLLLLRCAGLLVLALALADPSVSWPFEDRAMQPTDRPRHEVLVLDTSYSMQYTVDGVSRFHRACDAADQRVATANSGDRFSLVTLSDSPQVVIGQPALDRQQVRREIAELEVAESGAELHATVKLIAQTIANAAQTRPESETTQVVFVTDLDRRTWGQRRPRVMRQQLGQLAQEAVLSVVDVGQPSATNVAVADLRLAESIATSDRAITILATLRHTPGPPDNTDDRQTESGVTSELQLMIDGRPVSRRAVTIAAGGETTVAFQHHFEHSGETVVEARLAEDNLLMDNRRFLTIPVRQSLRVLCIEGKRGAAANIATALDPDDRGTRNHVSVRNQRVIQEVELSDFDVIFLCNLGRFDVGESRRLTEYCRHGGGLVVFLGDQVQPENYNRRLTGLFPVHLDDVSPEGVFVFDPRGYDHPLVAPFRGFELSGLLTTPVWRYQRMTDPVDTARVALWFSSGDLAIVERPIQRGRVIVVATAGSLQSVDRRVVPPTPWNAWPTWPSFPPIVHELLHRAAERARTRPLLVGQSFGDILSDPATSPRLRVEEPSGGEQWLRAQREGSVALWSFGPTRRSGVYSVYEGADDSTPRLFAVNVDTRESQLQRVLPKELPEVLHYEESIQTRRTMEPETPPRPLFRLLLGWVLTLLVSESVLAWWLGNRAA